MRVRVPGPRFRWRPCVFIVMFSDLSFVRIWIGIFKDEPPSRLGEIYSFISSRSSHRQFFCWKCNKVAVRFRYVDEGTSRIRKKRSVPSTQVMQHASQGEEASTPRSASEARQRMRRIRGKANQGRSSTRQESPKAEVKLVECSENRLSSFDWAIAVKE